MKPARLPHSPEVKEFAQVKEFVKDQGSALAAFQPGNIRRGGFMIAAAGMRPLLLIYGLGAPS